MRRLTDARTWCALGRVLLACLLPGCGAGEEVARSAEMPAEGSTTGRAPTWAADIAPLVSEHCGACHRSGGIAPFSVERYAEAKPHAWEMVSAVEAGTMPPFLATETADCRPRHPLVNDTRLSTKEKLTLRAWAEAGAPEGDVAHAAPLVPPPATALAREDWLVTVPQVISVAPGDDIHTCVLVDPALNEDVYVVASQIQPGNHRVLHHMLSHMVLPVGADGQPISKAELVSRVRARTGAGLGERYDCFGAIGIEDAGLRFELLSGWVPGAPPNEVPPDSGKYMPKDALVIFSMHYHPGTAPEVDPGTKLAMTFATARPSWLIKPVLLGNLEGRIETPGGVAELVRQPDESEACFAIPAGARQHVEEMTFAFRTGPFKIYAVVTHMHYLGVDMRVEVVHADVQGDGGARECLIETPRWNFNWQRPYAYDAAYDALPTIHAGDVLRLRCVYDNSLDNRFVRAALAEHGHAQPIDVRLGENTLDEMCAAGFGVIVPNTNP